jgi:hypothetical protein
MQASTGTTGKKIPKLEATATSIPMVQSPGLTPKSQQLPWKPYQVRALRHQPGGRGNLFQPKMPMVEPTHPNKALVVRDGHIQISFQHRLRFLLLLHSLASWIPNDCRALGSRICLFYRDAGPVLVLLICLHFWSPLRKSGGFLAHAQSKAPGISYSQSFPS